MFECGVGDAAAVSVLERAAGFRAEEDVADAGKTGWEDAVKCINTEFNVGEEVFNGADAKEMFGFIFIDEF